MEDNSMAEGFKDFQTTFLVKRIVFVNKMKEGNFSFSPQIGVAFNKINDKKWETLIRINIIDSEEHPFPIDLDVVVSMITTMPDELPGGFDLKSYLKVSSLNILFPYARSVVTNVTSAAMLNPLFLPIIDVIKLAENVEISNL